MSGTWAVVPVKAFERAKSRLAPALDGAARAALARALFDHVTSALVASGALDGILVATDSLDVARAAEARGAVALLDASPDVLGRIVDRALAAVAERGAEGALVVMSDLPLLEPRDVRKAVSLLETHELVVVPDARGEGTNALAVTLPLRLPTCFGNYGSFGMHCEEARRGALRFVVHGNERFGLDIDGPEDLAKLGPPFHAAVACSSAG